MTVDKRSVFTDALVTLGTKHNVAEGTRDAIHVAGRVCRSGQILSRGSRVGLLPDGRYGTAAQKIVGIVDPFLDPDYYIMENEVFWLMVFPRKITALRHVWEHPDFPPDLTPEQIAANKAAVEKALAEAAAREHEEKLNAAIEWMHDFWPKVDMDSYEQLMDAADDFVETGEHLVEEGRWENARDVLASHYDEFWANYEIIRGVTLTEDQKGGMFCCSC